MTTTLKTLIKKMDKIKNDTEKQVERIKSKALTAQRKNFDAAVKMLFNQHPKLESFAWSQYTPSWNDGDECVFSANTSDIEINGEEDLNTYWLSEKLKKIKNKKKTLSELEKKLVEAKSKKGEDWRVEQIKNEIKELDDDPVEIQEKLEMTEAVTSVLDCMSNDMLLEMFGDHARVVVTADGAEVEAYEHD